jgi:hypothetical protein
VERNRIERNESETVRLPRPAVPGLNPANFFFCAIPCGDPALAAFQNDLYRWAYERARAVAAPSLVERDLAGVWN